jgi:hypothetical protein
VGAELKKETRGAPLGSANAKKEVVAESFLHIRCKRADKAQWVKAAQGAGGLSEWVKNTLNAKSS